MPLSRPTQQHASPVTRVTADTVYMSTHAPNPRALFEHKALQEAGVSEGESDGREREISGAKWVTEIMSWLWSYVSSRGQTLYPLTIGACLCLVYTS